MNYHGYIDDFEYQQAKYPLENIFVEQTHLKQTHCQIAYIDVLDEVEELTGLNPLRHQ